MKKNIYIIGIVLAATVGLIALKPQSQTLIPLAPYATSTTASATSTLDGIHVNLTPTPSASATLRVGTSTYQIAISADETVLNVMRAIASSSSFAFTGREHPGLGLFVESINGKKSAGGYYWFLYINGVSSDTGASQTMLHPGDVAEWRYKQSDY